MSIPGLKPKFEVKAKVRIGVKKTLASGKEIPSSVDYFVCDHPEFAALVADKSKTIRIRFPFEAPADNWGSGLEWWRGQQLSCYSKGETGPTGLIQAYRVKQAIEAFQRVEITGPEMGRDRFPIVCAFRACPQFEQKDCKPIGRLQFFLDGGKTDAVYQLDTKSWNSIEALEATFKTMGNTTGRVFELHVEMQKKGRDHFPTLSLTEADVNVETPADVGKADAMVALQAALAAGDLDGVRPALAEFLNHTNPGWRSDQRVIDWIKAEGFVAAATKLLARHA